MNLGIKRMDHVCMVVAKLDERLPMLTELFGMKLAGRWENPQAGYNGVGRFLVPFRTLGGSSSLSAGRCYGRRNSLKGLTRGTELHGSETANSGWCANEPRCIPISVADHVGSCTNFSPRGSFAADGCP